MDKNPYDMQSTSSFAVNASIEDRRIGELISQLNRELFKLREDAFHEEGYEESEYYSENTKQVNQRLADPLWSWVHSRLSPKVKTAQQHQSQKDNRIKALLWVLLLWYMLQDLWLALKIM